MSSCSVRIVMLTENAISQVSSFQVVVECRKHRTLTTKRLPAKVTAVLCSPRTVSWLMLNVQETLPACIACPTLIVTIVPWKSSQEAIRKDGYSILHKIDRVTHTIPRRHSNDISISGNIWFPISWSSLPRARKRNDVSRVKKVIPIDRWRTPETARNTAAARLVPACHRANSAIAPRAQFDLRVHHSHTQPATPEDRMWSRIHIVWCSRVDVANDRCKI